MNKKRTVLYVGGFEMPDKNAAAHRVMNNARIFRNLGYHVIFCGVDKNLEKDTLKKIGTFDNYPVPYPYTSRQWIKHLLDFDHIQSTLLANPEVSLVVAYNMHALPLWRLSKYCRKNGIKIVADATEWYDNHFSFNPIETVKWVDTTLAMRYLQKRLDGIIAISIYLESYYSKGSCHVMVVPPLVDTNEEIWNGTETPDSDRLEFVYSGIPGCAKDKLGQIIQCFDFLNQNEVFHFTVLGITEKQFLETYPNLLGQLQNLGDAVTFCGKVPHQESITALKKADYCIFIRDRNRKNMAGFPTKFVESFTSGINILTNDVSDIYKYFPHDGNSIMLEKNDSESLIKALKMTLSKDLVTLRQKRRNGSLENPFHYVLWENQFTYFLESLKDR